jgi:tetratricopeptide (TPR) repeat protein
MHNDFSTLEKKCKRYRVKKFLKIALGVVLLVVGVSGAGFYAFSTSVASEEPLQAAPVVSPKKELPKSIEVATQTQQKKEQKSPKDTPYTMQINSNRELQTPPKTKTVIKEKPPKQKKLKIKKSSIKNTHFDVSVKKYDTLKHMQEMYKKEKKYSLALKIGEEYYAQKNYSKALQWSKEANILNHKEEGAWLLYAKSEYAKGNEERAIKLLRLYLGNAHSLEVESLLSEWVRKQK